MFQDSLLDRIDNIVSGANLTLTKRKITQEGNLASFAEIELDLKLFSTEENLDMILKDLIYFNQFWQMSQIIKRMDDSEYYIYLKLQISLPLPQRFYYTLNFKTIGTHCFIYIPDAPEMYYSKEHKCKDCNMKVYINKFNNNVVHSQFNLTCNEHLMKAIIE